MSQMPVPFQARHRIQHTPLHVQNPPETEEVKASPSEISINTKKKHDRDYYERERSPTPKSNDITS
jgi:hypothetical protein